MKISDYGLSYLVFDSDSRQGFNVNNEWLKTSASDLFATSSRFSIESCSQYELYIHMHGWEAGRIYRSGDLVSLWISPYLGSRTLLRLEDIYISEMDYWETLTIKDLLIIYNERLSEARDLFIDVTRGLPTRSL